jgi:tRNA (guanine-N7-)-methyltransferase
MGLFPRAEQISFTPSSEEALPDSLPFGWQGDGSPPLEIDVGCHKGRFLLEMARRFPFANFLGVERQRERVFKTKKKITLAGLNNAEVFHGDAGEVLSSLPDACADCVHILFPDPWPKRRHKHRRMVDHIFLVEVSRLLKAGGRLRLVTDDPDYARAMELHATSISRYRRIESEPRDYPPTEFQLKFVTASRRTFALLFERLS